MEGTGNGILLIAEDDGPGLPKAGRTRVFEPFFTTRRAAGGSGLGLPIVKSPVESAGGTVSVADNEGGRALCNRISTDGVRKSAAVGLLEGYLLTARGVQ